MKKIFKTLLKIVQFYRFYSLVILYRYCIFVVYKKINLEATLLAKVNDYKMQIPLKYDGIGRRLYVYRERELDHRWMMKNEISPGNIILDLGANIGHYLIMESKLIGKTGKIYAIEPDPRNIEFLKKNIKLNTIDNIANIRQVAISNKKGIAKFNLSSKTNLSSLVYKENNKNFINVELLDFGTYLKDIDRIDLVRMDIEGHELEVFDSLVKHFYKMPNHMPKKIIFETHLAVYKENVIFARKVLNQILEIGYKIKYLSSPNVSTTTLHKLGYSPIKTINDCPLVRGIYDNIETNHALDCMVSSGGIRTILLEFKK